MLKGFLIKVMGRAMGIEPTTSGTTNRCSTTELRSPSGSYSVTDPIKNLTQRNFSMPEVEAEP